MTLVKRAREKARIIIAACVAETLKKAGVEYVIDARLPIPPD